MTSEKKRRARSFTRKSNFEQADPAGIPLQRRGGNVMDLCDDMHKWNLG